MATPKNLIELLDQLEPSVRNAFLQSIQDIRSDAQMKALEAAIKSGSLDRVIRVLGLGAEYFVPLDAALISAYREGGQWMMAELVRDAAAAGAVIRGRFNDRNPRAETFLATQSSGKITGNLSQQTRQSVRDVLEAGMREGRGPRSVALDIVGRIDKATGKREGGIIGLSVQDMRNRDNALEELRSGSRPMLRNYLNRKTRDRRLDAAVHQAIRDGKPVPADKARKMINRMETILLRNRGETIARTELLGSLNHAGNEAMQQMIDAGKLRSDQIINEWDAQNDADTRPSHAAMDGQPQPHGSPFLSGDGFQLLFPGDSSLGAPAEEIINCRCVLRRRIDWIAGLGPDD